VLASEAAIVIGQCGMVGLLVMVVCTAKISEAVSLGLMSVLGPRNHG